MIYNKFSRKQLTGLALVLVFALIIGLGTILSDNNQIKAKNTDDTIKLTSAVGALEQDSLNTTSAGVSGAIAQTVSDASTTEEDKNIVGSGQEYTNAAEACGYTNLAMTNISEGNLNIRESATTDSKIVGKCTNHNACEVLGTEGEWTKITSGKVTGYIKTEYLLLGDAALEVAEDEITDAAIVNTQTLRVRSEATTDSKILSLVGDSEALEVTNILDGWVEVAVDDEVGYVSSEFVTIEKHLPVAKTIEEVKYGAGVSDVRVAVVQYALQFVGNRYVWGGTSLTNGVDCSGFTMQVLGKYGISLPHSSKAQPGCGTKISSSEAQPGDLFFYGSGKSINHVAIYIGNGQIVHASNKRDGIKISNAFYRTPICVVRYFN